MSNCENCKSNHDGSYGSGRFCSLKCSRSFSTKNKRKEINEKVRQKLTLPPRTKNCAWCEKDFLTKAKKKKFCSKTCSATYYNSQPEVKERLRTARLREIEKGNVGYGLKCAYGSVRCDSALEYAFIKWYMEKHPSAQIERFKGYLALQSSKYQPDFLVDGTKIVEVKYSVPYVGERLSQKWQTYLTSQEEKKKALENSGYEFMWITEKDIGLSFYRKCLEELKTSK